MKYIRRVYCQDVSEQIRKNSANEIIVTSYLSKIEQAERYILDKMLMNDQEIMKEITRLKGNIETKEKQVKEYIGQLKKPLYQELERIFVNKPKKVAIGQIFNIERVIRQLHTSYEKQGDKCKKDLKPKASLTYRYKGKKIYVEMNDKEIEFNLLGISESRLRTRQDLGVLLEKDREKYYIYI